METAEKWTQIPVIQGGSVDLPQMAGDRSEGEIVKYQFARTYSGRPLSPEERLMLAVLRDAVLVMVRGVSNSHALTKESQKRRLIAETRAWFLDRESEGPFTFESIWSTLFGNEWDIERARKEIFTDPNAVWLRLKKLRAAGGFGPRETGGDEL